MSWRRTCALLGVLECDALRVQWDDQPRLVRLMDVYPERAAPGGPQPATEFGRRALRWAKDTTLNDVSEVELEFPGEDVILSNSGKLLCYVHLRGENYNVRLVRDGWSPCFDKYGHPRIHGEEMDKAERWARFEGRGIWGGLGRRDYIALKTWWQRRAGQVACYRQATALGEDILDSRLDYDDIAARARVSGHAQVLADLARSSHAADGSVLIQLGSPVQPLAAYFPPQAKAVAGFLEREHLGEGKQNYLYFDGQLTMADKSPRIAVESLDQVSAFPRLTVVHQ